MKIEVPAKWVLAGEHSVLRGSSSIALPHPELKLKLEWEPAPRWDLEILPVELESVMRTMITQLETRFKVEILSRLQGRLTIKSGIPVGSGLGSSAALCVSIVRWLTREKFIPTIDDEYEVATTLEDTFHGRSSGMDIAVVALGRPVRFKMGEPPAVLDWARIPKFTFHDTGRRSSTRDCVERVFALGARDPVKFEELDQRMSVAVEQGLAGMGLFQNTATRTQGLQAIAECMRLGQSCFLEWGLLPQGLDEKSSELYAKGALAVKLTGAGLGGFLVALWPESPPSTLTPPG